MKYNWTAFAGRFEINREAILIKGEEIKYREDLVGPSISNLKCSEYFTEGEISAEITFLGFDNETGCEVIINYDNDNKNFITVGLGGAGYMYSIRSFNSKGWAVHAGVGLSSNLKSNKAYKLKITVDGSIIKLFVDDIDVLSTNLVFSKASQVGLWAICRKDIKVENYKVKSKNPKAFAIMQFGTPYDELYEEVIKEICDGFSLEIIRADESYGPGNIISDIIKQINESKVVIAEITPNNANVFYEVGYSHALGKPTILIAEKGTKLPFDLASYRTLYYENTIAGKDKIRNGLTKHLKAILEQ